MKPHDWILVFAFVPAAPALALVVQGCFNPGTSCLTHCWGHTQVVTDANSDNLFDNTCTRVPPTGGDFNPPLPNPEQFLGRVCIQTQTEHVVIRKVVDAILADDVGSLSGSEIQAYQDFAEGEIPEAAFDQCMNFLHFNCTDLIPATPSVVDCCTEATAETLCDTFVRDQAAAELNFDSGITTPVPAGTGTKTVENQESCDFAPELGEATEGMAEGGVDESAGAFGDIQEAIYCSPQTTCEVLLDLVEEVQADFTIFYDEGVTLGLTTVCGSSGAQLAGLNNGEYSDEIADELGLANGDLITHVNNITLTSEANISQIMAWLSTNPEVIVFKLRRGTCFNEVKKTYTITVVDPPTAP